MKQPFFARNYFIIFLTLAAFAFPVLRGARRAIESNNNNVKDWLPPSYEESRELDWFHHHFPGEQFAIVSWNGCTLGNQEKLTLLSRKLLSARAEPEAGGHRLYKSIVTGPETLDQLTSSLGISQTAAIRRLEGAMVGPRPEGQDDDARVTCLIATLSDEVVKSNRRMRYAIGQIEQIALDQCDIKTEHFHMGGPPVDNVTIDIEGERTLIILAGCAGVVGLFLSYWCLRSWTLTLIVFAVGVISAALSLAVVYYFGLFEILVLGLAEADFGTADAILMSMPAVVYVLGLSGAIHIINYYRDAVQETGRHGAAEKAIRYGWLPCTLAAITTAVGLGSLYLSDITPIKKFGIFSATGVMGTLALLFTWLPACLYRFTPKLRPPKASQNDTPNRSHGGDLPPLVRRTFRFVTHRHKLVCAAWLMVMIVAAIGLTKIETSVQLLKLFDHDADIINDYAWIEKNLGNLVPLEVILRVPAELCRGGQNDPEAGGQYRYTMAERVEIIRTIRDQLESLPSIGKSLSAADFVPQAKASSLRLTQVARQAALNSQLEKHRDELIDGDYLALETDPLTPESISSQPGPSQPGAELWRVSARVEALNDVDYGVFIHELRDHIEPILAVYQWRNRIVGQLYAQEKNLHDARVYILADSSDGALDVDAIKRLETLLKESGAKRVRVSDLARLPQDASQREATIAKLQSALAKQDCVVIATQLNPSEASHLAKQTTLTVDLASSPNSQTPNSEPAHAGISVVYTGVIPLVYKTQRELLISLQESIAFAAVLIALIMMCILKSVSAGLVSMIPNIFPIVLIFGSLGWLGIKVDIGIMMCASVALGVAVDDTIHFLYWFRKGMIETGDRKAATIIAYERCALAMAQTTIIGGLGLAVFALSSFTPTQQFGYLMVTLLTAALIGDLLLLPAILAGPVGRFFCGRLDKQHTENSQPPSDHTTPPSQIIVPASQIRHDTPHRSVRM